MLRKGGGAISELASWGVKCHRGSLASGSQQELRCLGRFWGWWGDFGWCVSRGRVPPAPNSSPGSQRQPELPLRQDDPELHPPAQIQQRGGAARGEQLPAPRGPVSGCWGGRQTLHPHPPRVINYCSFVLFMGRAGGSGAGAPALEEGLCGCAQTPPAFSGLS